jgi:hypothetical protein
MTLIVHPKNKVQEKALKAFLTSLQIGFHSEAEEEAAIYKAMEKGKKTRLLTVTEKESFIKKLSGKK